MFRSIGRLLGISSPTLWDIIKSNKELFDLYEESSMFHRAINTLPLFKEVDPEAAILTIARLCNDVTREAKRLSSDLKAIDSKIKEALGDVE